MARRDTHTTHVETTLQSEVVSNRVVTIPNLITIVRIAAIPGLVWLILTERDLAAVVTFVLIAGSDFVDGRIARRLGQVSALGKMLDPVADRVLLLAVAVAVTIRGIMPWPLVLVIAGREVAVSTVAIWYKAHGVQLEVRYAGKWAATLVMFSFGLFLGVAWTDGLWDWVPTLLDIAAWACGLIGACLGWWTVFLYVQDARAATVRHSTEVEIT